MKNMLAQIIVTSALILGILGRPQPHGFDDEGEISVPRSPKILGPAEVCLSYKNLTELKVLTCQIEASPTPSVVWLKNGQETGKDEESSPYKTTFDVTEGTTSLSFREIAFTEKKYMTGNFTCIAANFLGRVQKIFLVTEEEKTDNVIEKDAELEDDTSNLAAMTTKTILSHPLPAVSKSNDLKNANGTTDGDPDGSTFTALLPTFSNSTISPSTTAKMDDDKVDTSISSTNFTIPV